MQGKWVQLPSPLAASIGPPKLDTNPNVRKDKASEKRKRVVPTKRLRANTVFKPSEAAMHPPTTILKKYKDRVILTVDKGMAMVVMDKEEYVSKAKDILQQPAYRSIPRDPTNKIKAQLIIKLRRIKRDNGLNEGMYEAMYPTSCVPQSFIDYLNSIKQEIL